MTMKRIVFGLFSFAAWTSPCAVTIDALLAPVVSAEAWGSHDARRDGLPSGADLLVLRVVADACAVSPEIRWRASDTVMLADAVGRVVRSESYRLDEASPVPGSLPSGALEVIGLSLRSVRLEVSIAADERLLAEKRAELQRILEVLP